MSGPPQNMFPTGPAPPYPNAGGVYPPPSAPYMQPANGPYGQQQPFMMNGMNGMNHGIDLSVLFDEHNFAPYVREDFGAVNEFEIELIADNSYSMQGERWNRLKEHINLTIDFGGAVDEDGMNITFLNKQKVYNDASKTHFTKQTDFFNIKSSQQVENLFECRPEGQTPLSDTLEKVMGRETAKSKIILIATDGVPRAPNDNETRFENILKTRNPEKNRIVILLCVNDNEEPDIVDYYNHLDKVVPNLEVLHVYKEEKKQILGIQGKNFIYNLNDHIARMFLAPIYPEYDLIDEKKLRMTKDGRFDRNKTNGKNKNKGGGCCIVM